MSSRWALKSRQLKTSHFNAHWMRCGNATQYSSIIFHTEPVAALRVCKRWAEGDHRSTRLHGSSQYNTIIIGKLPLFINGAIINNIFLKIMDTLQKKSDLKISDYRLFMQQSTRFRYRFYNDVTMSVDQVKVTSLISIF